MSKTFQAYLYDLLDEADLVTVEGYEIDGFYLNNEGVWRLSCCGDPEFWVYNQVVTVVDGATEAIHIECPDEQLRRDEREPYFELGTVSIGFSKLRPISQSDLKQGD